MKQRKEVRKVWVRVRFPLLVGNKRKLAHILHYSEKGYKIRFQGSLSIFGGKETYPNPNKHSVKEHCDALMFDHYFEIEKEISYFVRFKDSCARFFKKK